MSDSTRPHAKWPANRDYLFATGVVLLGFAAAFAAARYLSTANLALILLTAVLAVAVRTRMSVAVYTAVLCFLGYNFFFTPPRYTLVIADADDVLAVCLFLVVALVCSRLATRLASQVDSLRLAQARAAALLSLGQRLAASNDAQSIRSIGAEAMAQALAARVAMVVRNADGGLEAVGPVPPGWSPAGMDLAAADFAEQHTVPAGAGTPYESDAGAWVLPLGTDDHRHGVVALMLDADADGADEGRRGLAVAMAQDIGLALERSRLAEALEDARVQGETERLRSALLSSVSHDLRSPLAAMIGSAGTLASYEQQLSPEERQQLMQSILDEGQRLDRYIQNLLDMTRLGHGALKLNRDWVDANEVVLAAVNRVRKFHPDLPVETSFLHDTVLLYVHPALIEQALFNILENAAHFSPPGESVQVRVDEVDGQLRIEVVDHGPGIPTEERARIFDTFYSVARGDSGRKGTGLGLSICRGMVGAHGGSVEALPGEGGGTTIRVMLPLPPMPEPGP
ncbi:ATP-binding protein [Rhodanobacter ginsengisoli]|uniref:histidine kinase n=1 Tax=Rhodanobacter ginsengisoli TaxID=418646 RepID=A0ABW0QNH3_9GAMM